MNIVDLIVTIAVVSVISYGVRIVLDCLIKRSNCASKRRNRHGGQ